MSSLRFISFFCLIISPLIVIGCGETYRTDLSRGDHLSSSRNKRDIHSTPDRKFCSPGSSLPPTRTNTTTRLKNLREEISKLGLFAYIIPSGDAHQSEYVAEEDKRRAWISGFTGSSGFSVVTSTSAAVWVDGRYYIQGEDQLDCNWIMMRSDEPDTPDWVDWLQEEASNIGQQVKLGADPSLTGAATWLNWEKKLLTRNIMLEPIIKNLVDIIWEKDETKKSSAIDVCREE